MTAKIFSHCPACKASRKSYTPGTAHDYEAWDFACGAQVLRLGSGNFIAEQPCFDALSAPLKALNAARVAK